MTGPDMWLGDVHLTDESHTFTVGDLPPIASAEARSRFKRAVENGKIHHGTTADGMADEVAAYARESGFRVDDWQERWLRSVYAQHGTFRQPPSKLRCLFVRNGHGVYGIYAGQTSDPDGTVVHIVTTL